MGQSRNASQTTSAPEWLQGPIQDYLGSAGSAANLPYEQYQGPQVAPFTGMQEDAFRGIGNTMHGSQGLDNAQGFTANLLGGAPGSNPYLNGIIQNGTRGATDAYNNAVANTTRSFNLAGAFGSSAHQNEEQRNRESLARGLGEVEMGTRYNDFNNSIGRQMQAVPMALQLAQGQQGLYEGGLRAGNLQQQYGQSLIDSMYRDWQGAQDYPWTMLDRYGGALRNITGAAGQNTTMDAGNNPWSNALGAGLLGYSIFGGR